MQIAIIGTSYPYRGGLAAYNERLALELQQQGHKVTMYTFTLQYPNFLFPGKTQYVDQNTTINLPIIRCINAINPLNWIIIGNKIKKAKPDLVIIKYWLPFMGPCFGSILRRIKTNKHTKVISIIDNIIPHEKRLGDDWFTKYFMRPVDGFIAMSQNVFDDINLFDSKKPKCLSPHPLFDNFGESVKRSEALAKLGLEEKYKYVLFFGIIRKYKGLDLLIKAFADNRFKEKNIKLLIAGEYYNDKEIYTNLIQQYQLENDVIQVDSFINDIDVKYYFSACDVVVQPYKSATQSGVTQIAYHFNKPMIVTNVGGLTELCPDTKVGYVVSPNANDIANAMVRFFDATDTKQMKEAILQEKKKYSWDILVTNILKLLKKINTTHE